MEEQHPAEHHEHHDSAHHEHHEAHKAKTKLDWWKISVVALIVILIVSILSGGFRSWTFLSSKEEVASSTLAFVNGQLLQGVAKAELQSVAADGDLYKMVISLNGQTMDTYVTKDGKLFFPQAIKVSGEDSSATPKTPTPEVQKSDKPKVELFVMSHCPYGTQAEKGILPVASLLGNKIDFEIKYVSYAMHGQKELNEQMNQVCIKKEQSSKFSAYLTCFLEDGDGTRCLTQTKIDTAKLTACVKKLDAQYTITAGYNDKSTWSGGQFPQFNVDKADNQKYGVQGSPTLVINGAQAESDRSPAGYLATICAAFNTAPEECAKELSAESYSPGFGYTISKDASGAATCG